MRIVYAGQEQPLLLGRRGENGVTEARFSIGIYQEELPGCVITLTHQRAGDPAPYPAVTGAAGTELVWTISSTDTGRPGSGKCQLTVTLNGKRMKSRTFETLVLPALDEPGPVPPPWQSWMDRVIAAGEAAEEAAAGAESAAATADTRASQAGNSALLANGYQQEARTYRDAANTARSQASTYAANAETAKLTAVSAAVSAETAAGTATTQATNAENSATNAANSATAAANSAATATTKAAAAAGFTVSDNDDAAYLIGQGTAHTDSHLLIVKHAKQAMDMKLGVADYSAAAAVGTADNLIDRKANGEARTFAFDTACGDASIEDDGTAEIRSIKGKTVVWNQLNNNNGTTGTNNGITFTKNNDGSWSVAGTVNDDSNNPFRNIRYEAGKYFLIEGHKYYIGGSKDDNVTVMFYRGSTNPGYGYGQERIVTAPEQDGNFDLLRISVRKAYTGNINTIVRPVCIDLTVMFGAEIADTMTVEKFRKIYPVIPLDHNEGKLVSFCAEGIRTVGFNQWDEQLECGKYNLTTGQKANSGETCRSVNAVHVLPDTVYCINVIGDTYDRLSVCLYDQNGVFISSFEKDTTDGHSRATFSVPNGCVFIRFGLWKRNSNWGTVLPDIDVCMHLVWSGYRNGDYEPYWTQTRALDLTAFGGAMKSAGTVYDEKDFVRRKNIKRLGAYTFTGSEAWAWNAEQSWWSTDLKNVIPPTGEALNLECKSDVNLLIGVSGSTLGMTSAHTYVRIKTSRNPEITSTSNMNSYFTAGKQLVYELPVSVETDIPDTEANTYRVADFGTEEIIYPTGEMSTPFTGVIAYSTDFTRRVATMNKNYQSQDSMDELLAALGTAIGMTIVKTWDANSGKWTYRIQST